MYFRRKLLNLDLSYIDVNASLILRKLNFERAEFEIVS